MKYYINYARRFGWVLRTEPFSPPAHMVSGDLEINVPCKLEHIHCEENDTPYGFLVVEGELRGQVITSEVET